MGIFVGDLKKTMNPLIEIDSVNPKVTKDGIVVLFRFRNEESAFDFISFAKSGPFNVQNAETSPVPNVYGVSYAFLEFRRSSSFVDDLVRLLYSSTSLIEEQMSFYDLSVNSVVYHVPGQINELKSVLAKNNPSPEDFVQSSSEISENILTIGQKTFIIEGIVSSAEVTEYFQKNSMMFSDLLVPEDVIVLTDGRVHFLEKNGKALKIIG